MIDHLFRFDTEGAAQADPIVGAYYTPATVDSPGSWRGDCCIPGVSVYAVTGTTTVTDPQTGATYQQEQRTAFSGWFIVIALRALDPALRDLPNAACRLIASRDLADQGKQFIIYTAPDVTQAQLAAAHVSPTFAGSNYPFGGA